MKNKKLSTKKLVALSVILPVLVIAVCSVVIYLTAGSVVDPDEIVTEQTGNRDKIKAPICTLEAETLVQTMLDRVALSGILKIKSDVKVDLRDISGENESFNTILNFVKDAYNERMSKAYQVVDFDYGGKTDRMKNILPDIDATDYRTEENGDRLKVTLIYPSLEGTEFENADRTMARKAVDENRDIFTITDGKTERQNVAFVADINKKDGTFYSITVERDYDVSMSVEFLKDLAEIGNKTFSFNGNIITAFNFDLAGIDIKQDKIVLHKKGYENLDLKANVSENAGEEDFTLTFTSSDPSVCTVDKNGMVEAVSESSEPVIITATLNYLGHEFTDSCEVYVLNEVNKIKLSSRKLTLAPGEEQTVTVSIKPSGATIQDVKFISADESIAEVNETGTIRAISKGETKIYALSADGIHGTACSVTVE